MNRFRELLESPQNELVEQAVADGRIPIGYSCSFVPEAFLMADTLFPVRLHAPGIAGTEIADIYLSNFICTYCRSLLEFAVDDRFDLIQGWVFVPSCAHMQRLFDNLEHLKNPPFNHILDVPRKVTGDTLAWQAEELKILAGKLATHFGVDMGDESLVKAISEWNQFAEVIQSIGELRKRPARPLPGPDSIRCPWRPWVPPKVLSFRKSGDFAKRLNNERGLKISAPG